MGDSGDNSLLGGVIFAGVTAGLVIICVWKIMWGRLPDDEDNDDHQPSSSSGSNNSSGDQPSVDDSGHISFATTSTQEDGSDNDGEGHIAMSRNESGHISFADDQESAAGGQGQGHVPVSIISIDHHVPAVNNYDDHIRMSRSSSSDSFTEYCFSQIFGAAAAMDYQFSPRHYRPPV